MCSRCVDLLNVIRGTTCELPASLYLPTTSGLKGQRWSIKGSLFDKRSRFLLRPLIRHKNAHTIIFSDFATGVRPGGRSLAEQLIVIVAVATKIVS
jgi:hypothetical protein